MKVYAFIDAQNLYLGIKSQGWKLDYRKFRVYLKDKYKVDRAFMFIGRLPGNESLYMLLKKSGYELIFKPTLLQWDNKRQREVIKGNVDAELVLHAVWEFDNYDKAIIISGDGDFHCLIELLDREGKLAKIIIPNHQGYSKLLWPFKEYFVFMETLKGKIQK